MTNPAAIESLRTFADRHGKFAFADLCAAALNGEEWAMERLVTSGFSRWTSRCSSAWTVNAIRSTDTTCPDGAIARALEV